MSRPSSEDARGDRWIEAEGTSLARASTSLALIGFMGSGKSVVGALVAYRARAPFLDLDFMIENEAAMRIHEIFARRGEAAFRSLESRLLPDALQSGGGAAPGGGPRTDDRHGPL